MSVIGILPAAGKATRIGGLPKYLLPVPEGNLLALHCQHMTAAGASPVHIGAGYHNTGIMYQYAPTNTRVYSTNSNTMSQTVLAARLLAAKSKVLFGMPDTYWTAPNVYEQLRAALDSADVAVAVWRIRSDQRGQLGQVGFDDDRFVRQVVDKDPTCRYEWAWGALAWKPKFWEYIKPDMPHVGYALQPAIDDGLTTHAICIDGEYHDCGSLIGYARLCGSFVREEAVK